MSCTTRGLQLTEIRWSPTAGSTFSTAFCKVERRPSNQTVSSTASHRPSNIPFAWFILFERNRQAWADVQTNQAKFRECSGLCRERMRARAERERSCEDEKLKAGSRMRARFHTSNVFTTLSYALSLSLSPLRIRSALTACRPPMESATGRRFHGKESSTLDSIRELG